MSDLERGRPKDYAEEGVGINGNRGNAQQVRVGDTTPSWVIIMAIVTAIVALIFGALGWWIAMGAMQDARDALREAQEARVDAARSSQKSETAERRANVSEIYTKQVYTELNRLGYPVLTPFENHPPQPSQNVDKEPK